MKSKYVSVRRFAEELGVTRAAAYLWITQRRVTATRIDGRLLIPRSEVRRVRSNIDEDLPVGVGVKSLATAK